MVLILLLVALAPGFFLLWYFWHRDRYEPEPKKKIILTFFLGAVMVIPAILIEVLLERGVNALAVGVLNILLVSFIVVAPTEELLKFFVVKKWVYNSVEFDEVMDGIVYMVSASLGFATLENIFYVFQHGVGTGVIRAFLAVPGHAFYAAVMGYYLGLAKFAPCKRGRLILIGIVLAIFFHGLYDFLLFTKTALAVLVIPLIIALGFIVRKNVKTAEIQSKTRLDEENKCI